jgi:alkanesulfonate monooxygenase SsuD/methylene tetrahydromethanopterin reductase-like flavin-dependent oxidoreductase (luciferase family)
VSWHRDEYDALGVPFGQRGEILDEQLEIWAKAWRGSPVNHDGKHYSFGPIWVEPPPARTGGPELWFGGSSLHPRLIARLVRYGSGFNPLGPAGDLGPLLQGHQHDHLRALDRPGGAGDRLRLHLRHPGQKVREQRAERPDEEHRVAPDEAP